MQNRIYLDNNSTTAVDPRVAETVCLALSDLPGNPSSLHCFGREAKQALMRSRSIVASCLGVTDKEIIFTSGGTETLNFLLQGIGVSGHIISTNVEHSAVFDQLKNLDSVTFLPVGERGAPSPESVFNAIKPDTKLIALMGVNNETGVMTDIEEIARIAKRANVPFIVDGVALFGKESFSIPDGVSAMAFSGHKFHAPKGVGFAYIKRGVKLNPLLLGGGQEFGLRSGTESLPLILGLAKAVEITTTEVNHFKIQMAKLRDYFEDKLKSIALVNGSGPRVANTSNLYFLKHDAETLLIHLDQNGVAASAGSACTSGALEPSRILTNMGYPKERVISSLRFSLSRFTTKEEIDRCSTILLKL